MSTELKHQCDVNTLYRDFIKLRAIYVDLYLSIGEFRISVTDIVVTEIFFLSQMPILTIEMNS